MSEPSYDEAPVAVRDSLAAAHRRAWRRIAGPGTWLDGERRVAIAAETRHARDCTLCAERKEALSPYAVDGAHDNLGALPGPVVEIIHRIATDPARLMERWYRDALAAGIGDTDYVETVAVVATVVAVDTFTSGLGMAPHPLPEPVAGAPARIRPPGAREGLAWVPTVAPEDATPDEADLYALSGAHIRRAMSLVPDEVRGFFDLVDNQYLSGAEMRDFSREFRAISHAQIELIAGRVSTLNQCLY